MVFQDPLKLDSWKRNIKTGKLNSVFHFFNKDIEKAGPEKKKNQKTGKTDENIKAIKRHGG